MDLDLENLFKLVNVNGHFITIM